MNVADNRVDELKQRVETEWAGDETARAWRKYYGLMKDQLKDVTSALVDAAEVSPGMVVLDLASGTGEPALSIARRVGPVGRVTATDISEPMLSVLRENAANEGVSNIDTEVGDAHGLRFADATFDRVTSRFGVMFFIEIQKALGEVRRVLKPGGRAAFLAWGKPTPDTFFGATVVPFMKRMDVPPDPDAPTPCASPNRAS
jgi:ubiquinone/menaquinone biosynthesis C-methylase UbiE